MKDTMERAKLKSELNNLQRLRQYLLEKDGYSKLDDLSEQFFVSVSYTHLDVYKRQPVTPPPALRS